MKAMIFMVEHFADGGDADEPGEAEGAAGHVLGEAFEAVAVAGRQEDAPVDVESAVSPGTHLLDEGGLDPAFIQQQAENLVLPEPTERFVGEIGGHGPEPAVGQERAVGDETVQVGARKDSRTSGGTPFRPPLCSLRRREKASGVTCS